MVVAIIERTAIALGWAARHSARLVVGVKGVFSRIVVSGTPPS
jgi:hypothetical protein